MTREEAKDKAVIDAIDYFANNNKEKLKMLQKHIDVIFDEHEKEKEHWVLHCDGLVSAHKHQCEAYEAQIKTKDEHIKKLEAEIAQYDYDYDALSSELRHCKSKLTRKPKIKDAVKCVYKIARKVGGCNSACPESEKFFWNAERKLCQIKDEYRHLLKDHR